MPHAQILSGTAVARFRLVSKIGTMDTLFTAIEKDLS